MKTSKGKSMASNELPPFRSSFGTCNEDTSNSNSNSKTNCNGNSNASSNSTFNGYSIEKQNYEGVLPFGNDGDHNDSPANGKQIIKDAAIEIHDQEMSMDQDYYQSEVVADDPVYNQESKIKYREEIAENVENVENQAENEQNQVQVDQFYEQYYASQKMIIPLQDDILAQVSEGEFQDQLNDFYLNSLTQMESFEPFELAPLDLAPIVLSRFNQQRVDDFEEEFDSDSEDDKGASDTT